MNKLPIGTVLPLRTKLTVVFIDAGKDTTIENLQHLPVTAKDRAEALELLKLLYPGAHMIGIHTGHTEMVNGAVVPIEDKEITK